MADLDHRPGKTAVEAVHGVLHRWGLVTGRPALFDASGAARARVANDEVARGRALPADLVLEYEAATGPQVTEVLGVGPAGPIAHVVVTACFGATYRLLESHATLEVFAADAADRCPVTGLRRVAAGEEPPTVRFTVRDPRTGEPVRAPEGFRGLMRAGVRLRPGWTPDWVCGDARARARWPDRRFARELAEALGSPLVELGLLE